MKARTIILSVVAILFLALAVYYFVTPAESLPAFMPGYQAGLSDHHVKHGLAALLLALGCGLLVWFTAGKKATTSEPSEPTE